MSSRLYPRRMRGLVGPEGAHRPLPRGRHAPRPVRWPLPRGGDQLVVLQAPPAGVPLAAESGGWGGLVYYWLHGCPRVYYSAYPDEYLEALAKTLVRAAKSAEVWCIFDNTAAFAATVNALDVLDQVQAS